MEYLEDRFEKKNKLFECVECAEDYRIWKVTSFGKEYYEGHFRRYQPVRTFAQPDGSTKTYPEAETYPGDEAFGKWAWTNPSQDKVRSDIKCKLILRDKRKVAKLLDHLTSS